MERMNSPRIHRMEFGDGLNSYYIMRDDLIPFSFGGNKVRKALLFFDDMTKKNGDLVVTYGSSSSNHCRVIANMASTRDIPCYIVSPLDTHRRSINTGIMKILGADIIYLPINEISTGIESRLQEFRQKGYNPYFIKGGGHGILGTRSYVKAYQEICDYERNLDVFFDFIFHAFGTGTTQAGLVCGKLLQQHNREIVGISIAREKPYGRKIVVESIRRYLESVEHNHMDQVEESVCFTDDYILGGYGAYNSAVIKTIKLILKKDGIPLDPVYTGKAFHGMMDYIRRNRIRGRNILFLHTGGTPLFFDYMF